MPNNKAKIRIAIEAQRIFRTHKHGMDFVALETIKQLQQIDHENQYYIIVSPGPDRCLTETSNFSIVEVACPTYLLWEQIALPKTINQLKPDLLHCTSNTAPIYCNVPLIVTLHDIIFLEKRRGLHGSLYQNMGWYYRRLVVPRILHKCLQIITVSNFEQNHIIEMLHLKEEKVKAIYNGFSHHFKPIQEPHTVTQKYLADKEYLFFLGNTDPKKNTARVFQAYDLYLKASSKKTPLLIADLKQEKAEVILKEHQLYHLLPHLRFSGYISNTDLPSIYSGASVFLYPSLRESFGIPILEAMACATPLITSNTSSMPEIAGDGAILIDPLQPQQISTQLLELETNPGLRHKQITYGLDRVKLFSWKQTALQLLSLYKSISQNSQ